MNNDWKNFLSANGARHNDDASDNASDNAKATTSNVLCDLSTYSTLVVAGDDAISFMQGQFTNDVEKIDADNSQMNGFCNKKGRMIANFRLFKHQQNHFLSIKNDLVGPSIEHLQNYILRAHVAVQDVSEQLIHLGLSGPDSPALLAEFIETVNEEDDSVSHNDNYIAIRVAGPQTRYEIFCSLEHAKALWEKLSEKVDVVEASSWDYLNIQAGLPYIDSHTSGEFVPQMVNMELINGVSFTKGCFTGQEIVARMHYLGKLKKRCYKIHIATEDRPKTGDKLFAENARAGQNTGALITTEKNPESGYDALAVIQIADTESKLFLNAADGAVITVKELPYSFDSE
jgi:folate-binding protein YgfZ